MAQRWIIPPNVARRVAEEAQRTVAAVAVIPCAPAAASAVAAVPLTDLAGGGADAGALVYDVARVRGGKVTHLDAHIDRIRSSVDARFTNLPHQDVGKEDKEGEWLSFKARVESAASSALVDVAKWNQVENHNVKLVAWRDEKPEQIGVGMVAYVVATFYPPSEWYSEQPQGALLQASSVAQRREGASVVLLFDAWRDDPNVKAVSSIRDRAVAAQRKYGVFEALLVHPPKKQLSCDLDDYIITEGSRSNLLVIRGNRVLCSPPSAILYGITLQCLKRRAMETEPRRIEWEERWITLGDVLACDACVMTGTSVGVLPIRSLHLPMRWNGGTELSALDDEAPSLTCEIFRRNVGAGLSGAPFVDAMGDVPHLAVLLPSASNPHVVWLMKCLES